MSGRPFLAIKAQILADCSFCFGFSPFCSPGSLLWGHALFWGTQVVGPVPVAALRLCATKHLSSSSIWTTVATALIPLSPPTLYRDSQTFHPNARFSSVDPSLSPSTFPFAHVAAMCHFLAPGSPPPTSTDCEETHREHACWEPQGSEVAVSRPQSPHVITWHLS